MNVQAPFELAGKSSTIAQLVYKGVPSNKTILAVADLAPELYRSGFTTQAAALNEDGTVNSAANPAQAGSTVTLYATGAGQTSPPGATGKAAQAPYPQPLLPVALLIGAKDAQVVYSGAAPGMVGVLQVNARLPAELGGGSVQAQSMFLRVGEQWSRQNLVTLWVK